MKVFLSWSGRQSKEVAEALREWLPDVLHVVTPWMSSSDIQTGRDFSRVLRKELAESNFGVLCLTKDNCWKPWVLFEAGALAKILDSSLVCPYLIGMESGDLPHPLRLFQAAMADENGTYDLVRSLNNTSDSIKLFEPQLRRSFDRWWPDLKPRLESKAKPLGPSSDANLFSLINVKTGNALRTSGLPHKNGEPLESASYTGDEREAWGFHKVEKGYFAVVSPYTGQCLDVEGHSAAEGAKIHQWEFNGGDNQKWALATQKDGSFKLRGKHSGRYLSATDDGIKQTGETESRTQRWWITPIFDR